MDPSSPPTIGRGRVAAAVLILVAAVVGVVLVGRVGGDDPAMLQVAPGGVVELDALPATQQSLYLAAAEDPEAFREVRCYCGCESFLDHRHLLDCFVRPDGGWERHATGCGVCLAEAQQVVDLRADDVPIDEISRRIDERYGAMTEPAA